MNIMKIGFLKKIIAGVSALAAAVLTSCCSTPPQSVELTAEDYNVMAKSCLEQIYQTGVFDDFDETPKIKVSRIIDRTSCGVQTSWITDIVITELNRNGKVIALSEDAYSKDIINIKTTMGDNEYLDSLSNEEYPDITLSGNIRENSNRVGRTVTKTYRLTLDINKEGKKVGSYCHEVTKTRTY